MYIPSVREIKDQARQSMGRARDPRKLILVYTAIVVAMAAVLTVINGLLANRIDGTGGLANMGIRSILTTAQNILPIVQTVVLMGLEFGYLNGILRISRGQYADHTDLKVGFRRFSSILRLALWQSFLIFGLSMMLFYISVQIFMLTSWANPLIDLLTPLVSSAGANAAMLMDEATLAQAYNLMIPMLIIYCILLCVVMIPVLFRFRMARYVLLDDPRGRGFAALKTSTRIMRRNCFRLFRLDLSFWWYYGLLMLCSVVSYGDVILSLLGIPLPFSDTVAIYLFFFIYLILLFAVYYFLRNPVEVAYAKAYDAIRDKPVDNGVVLGNIFDM